MSVHIKNPPEAKPERISRLLTRIETGDVKIPVFQRKYVWKRKQIIELLDSILKGYPIGSLLFWLSDTELADERNIADFNLPKTKDKYPRNYVLDGQQRIATIYAALKFEGNSTEKSVFNVHYDLVTGEFQHTSSKLPDTKAPLNILFDTRAFRNFQTKLSEREDAQELLDASDVLSETFREYSIPVVTVTETTIDDVSKIFERINSTGTKLTVYDLMVAATWSNKFDLRDRIDKILAKNKKKDYQKISPVAILQSTSAIALDSAKRSAVLDLRNMDSDELTKSLALTESSLDRAIDFLIGELSVVSSHYLPYERQIVGMVYAISKKPHLSSGNIDSLKRWFWRTSFSERYRRGGEGRLDEDLKTLVTMMDQPSLLETFGQLPSHGHIKSVEFRKASAFTNAFIALLADNSPRNLINGSLIDIGKALSKYNRKEFHHIFPKSFLNSKGFSAKRANSIINICMLSSQENKIVSDKPPSEYTQMMESSLGADLDDVLSSNLISQQAYACMKNDDFEGFIDARSATIDRVIGELV